MRDRVCLLIFTDGSWHRLRDTLYSFQANINYQFDRVILMDDSLNAAYKLQLTREATLFNGVNIEIFSSERKLGLCRSVERAWKLIIPERECDWIFQLEEGFSLQRAINLSEMIETMKAFPYLAQINLRSRMCNDKAYEQKIGWISSLGITTKWHEHLGDFPISPCLYSRSMLDIKWPKAGDCENELPSKIRDIGNIKGSAYWGLTTDLPLVIHTGKSHVGMGY